MNAAALYLRISTSDKGQELRVQEEPLREWVARLGYAPVLYREDGVSGAQASRPQLDRMMKAVRRREYRAVAVWRLDRLGRSALHLLQLAETFRACEVRLLVHDMALDTSTPQGQFFFTVIAAFAEMERGLIIERINDGLAFARTHGTKSGRPLGRPAYERDLPAIFDAVRCARETGGESLASVARRFDVSRGWIYQHVIPVLEGEGRPKTRPDSEKRKGEIGK